MCEWGNLKEVSIKRKKGLDKVIKVDSCIADLIVQLNDFGLYTINSCCGHNKSGASIIFEDIKLLNTGYAEVYNREAYDCYWQSLPEEEKVKYKDHKDIVHKGW